MTSGPGDVLDLIRRGRASTRGELLAATGLSRMTVAQRVDALLEAGLIVDAGSGGATGGRRPRSLVFNRAHGQVISIAVDTTHTLVAMTDLAGRVLVRDRVDVAVTDGPDRTLGEITQAVRALLDRDEPRAGRLSGIGISVPGPVDPTTGRASEPPIMPGWDAYPIPEHLQTEFDVPVLVANDADAAAVGEHANSRSDSRAFCFVKVSTGIGTGIVVDGEVYTGVDGGAGDIGHVRLADRSEALCQCGARGCLAAVASGRAVARSLTELGKPAVSGHDVGELLARGDADAARLTQEAGRTIGVVMATVVCLLNPGVLLLGGDLASAPLLAGVRESLYPLSLPRATRHLMMGLAALGNDAAVMGLTRLVVDREFSADAVNARL